MLAVTTSHRTRKSNPMTDLDRRIDEFRRAADDVQVDGDRILRRLTLLLQGTRVPVVSRRGERSERSAKPTQPPSTTAGFARPLVRTLTLEETLEVLAMEEPSARSLIERGELQCVKIADGLGIPEWQLDEGSPNGLIGGLGVILRAAEGRYDWVQLALFMLTPQPALTAAGSLSVVEWLHHGFPVEPVLEIVRVRAHRDR